jgi:hypothetical protein
MIGQKRPITALSLAVQAAAALCVAVQATRLPAEVVDVRLRIAWGSGAQAPQRWSGAISVSGATISDLQPLGIEADEAAALRLANNEVVVAPIAPRAFDGCDVTIRGDDAAVVAIRLQNPSAAEAKEVRVALSELLRQQYRAPLDDLGGYLLVNRAPGDMLRVSIERAHLVFSPGESFKFSVRPDVSTDEEGSSLVLEARLRHSEGGEALWESSRPLGEVKGEAIPLELLAPADEGAYRLSLTVRRPAGLTAKLAPWQQQAPVAARDVEFVVIDPNARLPRLADAWDAVQTIDPANTKWWQRMPDLSRIDRLQVLPGPRSLGNVKPVVKALTAGSFVELPAPASGAEPAWHAYPLTVRDIGQPHAVEIDLPAETVQQLAVSVIEPDAAGRVQSFGRDAGIYVDGGASASAGASATVIRHRIVFWPRTSSPWLLVANHSSARAAEYGSIRVLRRLVEEVVADPAAPPGALPAPAGRLVAAYISLPKLAECLGAAEQLDAGSGLSVDGWGTFLEGGRRLAQHLRAEGFNAAIISIAADGSSLAPIEGLGASPRYDTGPLSAGGADVVRKDVLEALLRVFDREGLRIVPAIELATPLPALEEQLQTAGAASSGASCVGVDGRTWSQHYPGETAGPRYNVLDPRIQRALGDVIDNLLARYGSHAALSGVAVQLAGRGYGVLPGPAWMMDDATIGRFATDAQVELPTSGDDRFKRRASVLLDADAARWNAWRQAELTKLYADLASRVGRDRPERELVLCTENLFTGPEASRLLRQAVSGRGTTDAAAAALGVDLAALAATPGVCLLRPRRLASEEALQERATDFEINSAADVDRALASQARAGELFYHMSRRLRLPSFDAQSPFGGARTYASLPMISYPTGVAMRQPLATALASRDFFKWVEGGELVPLVQNDEATRLRRLFQELPASQAESRVERRPPVTLRVYRTSSATTVCLVNESPWSVDVALPIEMSAPCGWRDLGGAAAATKESAAPAAWSVALPPYGVAARRYETHALRVGTVATQVAPVARADLATRLGEIEKRMSGLDFERPYPQLANPDFQVVDAEELMPGWQPRIGTVGHVAISAPPDQPDGRSLHLRSEDALGVAAQSTLFPLPASGQLTIRAQVRVGKLAPDAKLYAWVEYATSEGSRTSHRPLNGSLSSNGWTTCEATFDDLPIAAAGPMRVQFHLAGPGEAWVDDIALFDFRIASGQRLELLKRLLTAQKALEAGQLVDCQRWVDSYWPRYLVEYVPAPGPDPAGPGAPDIRVAARPDESRPPAGSKNAAPGFGDRVFNLFR